MSPGEIHTSWEVGSEVLIPRQFSLAISASKSKGRQLVAEATTATVVEADRDGGRLRLADGTEILVLRDPRPGQSQDSYLVPPLTSGSLLDTDPTNLSWVRNPQASTPESVIESLTNRFALVEERDGQPGFRQPQAGAIHAVLGYWTTQPSRQATVVMPTGTGKTDTMVALFTAVLPERLLVIVPSDALRTQISEKFEELGILPGINAVIQDFAYPVVGRLEHGFKDPAEAIRFARACNVVVATPAALNSADPESQLAFLDEFSHLFVDEAHHVGRQHGTACAPDSRARR